MIFFLIVPVWLLCLVLGMVLVCLQGFRRTGIYVMAVSTGGTLFSLLFSTAVLYLAPRIGPQRVGNWSGVVLIGAYVLAGTAGGLAGSFAGFALTRKLLARK